MKTKEIVEGTIDQISNEGIDKDTLYSIKDYPIGGITNQQMGNALLDNYLGFYPINAVFTCVDDGVYTKNHLYKFTKTEETYIWEDITISSGSSGSGSSVEINSTDTPVGVANYIKVNGLNYEIQSSGSSSGNNSSLPIGSIFTSALPQTDAGVHILDGSTIALDGIYAEFVNLFKTLVNAGYNLTCTQEEYDSYVSVTGSCGKFVLDETNNTLRLPKITTFIQGLTDLSNIGNTIDAGLPNITGEISRSDGYPLINIVHSQSGSLQPINDTTTYSNQTQSASATRPRGITFNASLSNSIYGNSNTVQPPSVQYPYYIVLSKMGNSSSSNQNIYSTEETPIGVWIDGKTIYRRVITKTMDSQSNIIDLSSWNIDTLITQSGFNLQTGSSTQNQTEIPIYVSTNDYAFTFFRTVTKVLELRCGSAIYGDFTIILEYTKTTD